MDHNKVPYVTVVIVINAGILTPALVYYYIIHRCGSCFYRVSAGCHHPPCFSFMGGTVYVDAHQCGHGYSGKCETLWTDV